MERENTMGKTKLFLYRQRFGYGLGDFACNLIWQMISLYLLYFYTDVMKLNAGAVAVMFLVCRVIDAITDVLVIRCRRIASATSTVFKIFFRSAEEADAS